jgi:hypothetical protein
MNQSHSLRLQLAEIPWQFEPRSLVAIGAGYARRQNLDGRKRRIEIQVHKGKIDLGAVIVFP